MPYSFPRAMRNFNTAVYEAEKHLVSTTFLSSYNWRLSNPDFSNFCKWYNWSMSKMIQYTSARGRRNKGHSNHIRWRRWRRATNGRNIRTSITARYAFLLPYWDYLAEFLWLSIWIFVFIESEVGEEGVVCNEQDDSPPIKLRFTLTNKQASC